MPPSYHADEKVFQKLRAVGKSSWDEQADPLATFENFILRPFIEESLALIARPLASLCALEIGCGTGPVCCSLAAKGLAVRGIDVSPTALDMARHSAAQRGLNVQFDAADICNMPEQAEQREQGEQGEQYDLIIDGHCLHCLVSDAHRQSALSAVHRLLKPDGLFLIETMISHPGLIVGTNYHLDPQCILSIKVDKPAGHDGAFTSGSVWFTPYRRLLTAEQLATELTEAGFASHSRRAVEQKDPRKPMLLQVRAGHRAINQ